MTMGVHPSEIKHDEPPQKPDYTKPIARSGEQQFACLLRNRSGHDAGCIDFGLRNCTFLGDTEQQDMCDTAFALYQSICDQLGKRALNDKSVLPEKPAGSVVARFLDALWPSRVCRRTGECDWKQVTIRGYQYPSESSRGVADEVVVTISQCRRCGRRQRRDDNVVVSRDTIHSLSLDSDAWQRLRETGFIES